MLDTPLRTGFHKTRLLLLLHYYYPPRVSPCSRRPTSLSSSSPTCAAHLPRVLSAERRTWSGGQGKGTVLVVILLEPCRDFFFFSPFFVATDETLSPPFSSLPLPLGERSAKRGRRERDTRGIIKIGGTFSVEKKGRKRKGRRVRNALDGAFDSCQVSSTRAPLRTARDGRRMLERLWMVGP